MRLELKHLAPYLPYGLKMTRNGFVGELISIKADGTITVSCSDWLENINDGNSYKPILRPLSDLIPVDEYDEVNDMVLIKIVDGTDQHCDAYDEWRDTYFDDELEMTGWCVKHGRLGRQPLDDSFYKEHSVIGNIHQNPELL